METGKIKKFATEARNILKRGIEAKIMTLGFTSQGQVPEASKPQLIQGGCLWNGTIQTEGFYKQWMSLYRRVEDKGIREVYEEAAYTWFNRLMAIRILQKNHLCEPVMEYADEARTPRIVDEARMGRYPQMSETERTRLVELLDDDTKTTEQFALLVTAFCHDNAIISACFGRMEDYTELLLPLNILAEGGFVDMINHTEFISDDDFHSPELIGWLYQFYISERKDEVFAKKGKYDADEIAPATQIFTPNWIVKYMVQNTVGRIYLDNNPWEKDELKEKWQYLVEDEGKKDENSIYEFDELTELKFADLSCGSSHILNEIFDILFDLYVRQGYSRKEAIQYIFERNITGIDLDTRAKQLATFALLLKACQRDPSFADARCMPNVLDMPKVNLYTWKDTAGHMECNLPIGRHATEEEYKEICDAFSIMEDADCLGSIMKFELSDSTRQYMKAYVDEFHRAPKFEAAFTPVIAAFRVMLALTEHYSGIAMNPPYMGGGSMNKTLADYVKKHYESGKADLCTVFMLLAIDRLAPKGKYGMINMHSWMFLSSFEKLRKNLLDNYHIDNLLHLGARTFDELSGEVVQNAAFVVAKSKPANGTYYRLVDGKNCADKKRMFLAGEGHYANVSQQNFEKIPGCPIGYWVSKSTLLSFSHQELQSMCETRCGMATGRNDRFLRYWHEVDDSNFFEGCKSSVESKASNKRWYPYDKAGEYRKWYGNREFVVDWLHDGHELQTTMHPEGKRIWAHNFNLDKTFQKHIGWSDIISESMGLSFRYFEEGFLFDGSANAVYETSEYKHNDFMAILAYSNSCIPQLVRPLLNPTIHFKPGNYLNLPYKHHVTNDIVDIAEKNISISKQDWDAHETSWDFQQNELIALNNEEAYIDVVNGWASQIGMVVDLADPKLGSLEWLMDIYQQKWETKFMQLHANEEELNRQFIDIYGLQDELTPDVPMNEITILQQGEINIVDNEIKWNEDVVIKQLISYAVGTWMGRYRLDRKGLAIAHQQPAAEELAAYDYNGQTVRIDDDGIIPILPSGSPFDDNLPQRIADFVRIAFGEDNLTQNLNYMEQCLGKTIEQYCLKDFWKDHKKMYQNRPIYWLFSSKKGAFQCISYMHRMTPYTAEQVRAKYLLPYIDSVQKQINDLDARAAELSTKERKQLDTLRKTLDELREYHDRLQVVAEDTERTKFDLDDGVVVNYAKYGDVLAKIK